MILFRSCYVHKFFKRLIWRKRKEFPAELIEDLLIGPLPIMVVTGLHDSNGCIVRISIELFISLHLIPNIRLLVVFVFGK